MNYAAGAGAYSVAVSDFDGDGKLDLVVANNGSDTVSILRGAGNGTFAAPVTYGAGSSPASVAVGDFDGDDKNDIAASHSEGDNVSILLNRSGVTSPAAAAPVPALDPTTLAAMVLMLGMLAAGAMRSTRGRQAPAIHPSTGSTSPGSP